MRMIINVYGKRANYSYEIRDGKMMMVKKQITPMQD